MTNKMLTTQKFQIKLHYLGHLIIEYRCLLRIHNIKRVINYLTEVQYTLIHLKLFKFKNIICHYFE